MSNQLAKINETPVNQMIGVIERVALDPNADVAKLEKMMDLQERILDRSAKDAYSASMTACQGDLPVVLASSANPQTHSTYAKLENILEVTKPKLLEYGFAVSFGQGDCDKENMINVFADVIHKNGHKEHYAMDTPIDMHGLAGKVNKTAVHGMASAQSYARRYLFCMIFNITIAGNDDDGNGAGQGAIERLTANGTALVNYWNNIKQNHWVMISRLKELYAMEDAEELDYIIGSITPKQWFEMERRAPTKGGVFTVAERTWINKNMSLATMYFPSEHNEDENKWRKVNA